MTTATKLLTEVPALMMACCEPDNIRYDLKLPYVDGDYLWATNGMILARQPIEDFSPDLLLECSKDRGKVPKSWPVWEQYGEDGEPFDLPIPEEKACEFCGGIERVLCEVCLGGRFDFVQDSYEVGPATLASNMIVKLVSNGVSSVRVVSEKDPVRFSVGRIEGLLMPMTKPTTDS